MAAVVNAAPGDLDSSFGTGGKVITDIGSGSEDISSAVGIAASNKPVVIGTTNANGSDDFVVVRYKKNGTLDTSFGTGGKVLTDFGSGSEDITLGGIVEQNGKIVAVGFSNKLNNNLDFATARYNKDGSLDSSFGSGGMVLTDFGGGDAATGVISVGGGKLVVVGGASGDFAIVRYNKNGTLDTSFGTGGKVTTNLGGSNDTAEAVVQQSDGKIVVAGHSNAVNKAADFAVVRYNRNGSLDMSFGTGGMVLTDFGGNDIPTSVVLAAKGKIVVGGNTDAGDPNGNIAFARYNKNGSLDTSFGTGGKVLIDIGTGSSDDLGHFVAQPGNKILAVGSSDADNPNGEEVVLRLNSAGALDSTFGTGGEVFTDFGGGASGADAIAVKGGKAVVAGGTSADDPNFDIAVTRYLLH
jgi:uncharacterized delta-60 repeat protein